MTSRREVLSALGGGIGFGLLGGGLNGAGAQANTDTQGGLPTDGLVYDDPSIGKDTPRSNWAALNKNNPAPSVPQNLDDPALVGAIDLHAHSGPDAYHRQWDAYEVARLMQDHGMRGCVNKNHYTETAGLAYMCRKYATPLMEVFGAVAFDLPTGGVNPQTVRYLADVVGGYARVVWMPTHDCEHEVKFGKQARPFVRVSENGKLVPQMFEALDVIAEHDLTLATGHVSAEEVLMIMTEAKKRGVKRIIMTHPFLAPNFSNMTVAELKDGAAMGGYFEITAGNVIVGKRPGSAENREKFISAIRAVGVDKTFVSSDSGLTGGLNHTDALALAAKSLRQAGFTEPELDQMFKHNPAYLVKLPILKNA